MGAQNSEIPTSDALVDVYCPTTQPTADISLDANVSYEGVSSFLGDDVQQVEEYGPKGSITKRLRGHKIIMVNENFFNPTPANPQLFPIEHPQQLYSLSHQEMNSLRPGIWLFETVMDAYMCLLRDREVNCLREGINRWATFGFMPSFFMHLGKGALSVGDQIRGDHFCHPYVTPPAGPPLHECDFIFMPICCPSNSHFVLLTFMVSSWRVSILDPLYNDTPYIKLAEMYKDYVDVAVQLIPLLLRMGNPFGTWPRTRPKVRATKSRPTQENHHDCGIFVCKYVDYFLHGNIDLGCEAWSAQDVSVFRYRLAYELFKGKARDIPH